MNFDQLRYVREITLAGSFTKAADNLFITQAGLTYQVKQLENELGFKLFKRDSHHVELTEQGVILRPIVENILALWDDAYRRAVRLLGEGALALNVGLMDSMDEQAVLRVDTLFRERHPSCTIVLSFMEPLRYQSRINDLLGGVLDLAFISDDEISSVQSLDFVPLSPQRGGVLVRRDDVLAGRQGVSFEDLAGRRLLFPNAFVLPENKMRLESTTKRLSGLQPSVDAVMVSDMDAMRMMVLDGDAVGIQVYSSTKGLEGTGLALVPLEDGEEPVRFGVAYLRATANPLVHDYVELCRQVWDEQRYWEAF